MKECACVFTNKKDGWNNRKKPVRVNSTHVRQRERERERASMRTYVIINEKEIERDIGECSSRSGERCR